MFSESPGSDAICRICFWEDDVSQLRFARLGGGANRVSLLEAQRNFLALGAIEARFRGHVRPPGPLDRRDPTWRPLDEAVDAVEDALPGADHSTTYPADTTTLYYWRPTFWRHDRAT